MDYIWLKKNFKLATFCNLVFLLAHLQSTGCKEIGENIYQEFKNCTLKPASEKVVLNLEKRISDNIRLIQMSITVEWTNSTQNDTYLSTKEWFMSTSVSGQRLLLLPDHFSEMSLGTLSYSIADVQITMKQEPEDCLANFTLHEAEHLLKYALLTLPNNPETRNENGISKLHICNRTSNSNGDCCALTLKENDVICKALEHDRWGDAIKILIQTITFVLLLQCVSLIPRDVYKENENETFTLSDTTVNMHLQVTNHCTSSDENKWDKVYLASNNVLRTLCEKLNEHLDQSALGDTFTVCVKINSITSTVDKRQLHSESFPSLGILMFLYVSFRDLFRLRKSSGRCCDCVSHQICFFSCVDLIRSLLFILLLFPYILKVVFLSKYTGDVYVFLNICCLFVLLLQYILLLKTWKDVFQKYLRVTFETESITKTKYKGSFWSFFLYFVIKVKSYFPLLQFLSLVLSDVWQSRSHRSFSCFILLALSSLVAMFYLVIDCVLFYVECFFCTTLGLLLNYNKVVQYVLLFLIVVKYAYDSISDVQSKIRQLTITVFKKLRELCTDKNSAILIQGNDESRKLSRFAISKCGSLYWLPRGVILFDELIKPENIYFKHLSKKFIDYISSLPGHLTPGSKYSLLFLSGKEIASVIAILFLVMILVLGFGNVNDLSSSVLTIVTFVTGAVSSVLAKLWFKDTEYVVDGDLYFCKLIEDHLAEYEEPWIIKDLNFDIMACERISEQNVKDRNIGIVVERQNRTIACFLKPLVQRNTLDWADTKTQLKGMFISSSDDEDNETETSDEHESLV